MRSIGLMLVVGTLAAPVSAQQAARTPPPAEMKGQPSPQGFSVVLVLGDLNSGANADGVPAAARKALADMKDFLPYKGYRLLDAEWILGSRRATTRLRGPDNQDYELTLTASPAPTTDRGKVHITFQLRDAAEPSPENMSMISARSGARASMERRVRDLEAEIAAQRAKDRNADVSSRERELAELKSRIDSGDALVAVAPFPPRSRSVIDTSFDMDTGETVVVGTSRLRDSGRENGRALIALLTAVPKNGAPVKDK